MYFDDGSSAAHRVAFRRSPTRRRGKYGSPACPCFVDVRVKKPRVSFHFHRRGDGQGQRNWNARYVQVEFSLAENRREFSRIFYPGNVDRWPRSKINDLCRSTSAAASVFFCLSAGCYIYLKLLSEANRCSEIHFVNTRARDSPFRWRLASEGTRWLRSILRMRR